MSTTATHPTATETATKVAVTYLRVSTTRQMSAGADVDAEGNSIATQREWSAKKAVALGASLQQEFVEPGASAQTIEKRPVFKQMLAYLGEHPEVDYVIIYMRSRAFRNLGDAVMTKRTLERLGVKLVSAKEDFGDGIMADAMEAVTDIMNEVQVRLSGEDIKIKLRHKVENGGTTGRAKLGYLNVRVEHDGRLINSIALDQERAPLVKQAFELYATGDYSLERLHVAMADLGFTTRPSRKFAQQPVSIAKLHTMLRDPYYVGIVTYKGEQFPGRHEPIIDQDLFDQVQQVMNHRSKRGQRDRVLYHYLKGLLYCDRCAKAGRNARLIYTEAKGRGGTYAYYLCRGRQDGVCDLPYLPVDRVEDAVARHYVTLGLPTDFLTEIREAIDQNMASESASIRELHARYRRKLTTLAAREEKLLDLTEDGALPRERIRARLRQLQIERHRAEQGLTETGDKIAQ
ncbi:recombinase family protein [Rudaeicoccus suwonensis]|uniref:DNA invertase Pin-like site-specific DNA recombinase n=1 Tax=Rudaeicoccus suwonensis TaxID=657409 RepID=A0A561EAD2_9MICO|nr:recombinase family protein [Rudaeicoccus suwonensis]TWE12566.1 DNA invertase Pin-like site-specific DNA recombinase [Rudaeicoccus suwonensis]